MKKSVDLTNDDRFPYLQLERTTGRSSFRWTWRIISDLEDETRGYGSNIDWGLAITRWGALWDGKRTFRKYLKNLETANRIERIPL